jgi:hypothetical protein
LARSSAGSEDSTRGCGEPDCPTCSSANPTTTDGTYCESGFPESPSTRTYEVLALDMNPDGNTYMTKGVAPTLRPGTSPGFKSAILVSETSGPLQSHCRPGSNGLSGLTFSPEGSPAKTSLSPDDVKDSPENDPVSSTNSPGLLTLFDPAGYSLRTYPGCSPQTAVGTSESCLERWPISGTAWDGGLSTAVSSECRSAGGECSSSEPSLTEILEPPQNVAARYSLSARAAIGILRRAEKRGRTLPMHLRTALETVRGPDGTGRTP